KERGAALRESRSSVPIQEIGSAKVAQAGSAAVRPIGTGALRRRLGARALRRRMVRTDIYSARKRSEIMRRVRGKDTSPELLVRGIIRRLGVRFRIHVAGLPGRPDIAMPDTRKI